MHPRDTPKDRDIEYSPVQLIIKTKSINQLKHFKTLYMNYGTSTRTLKRTNILLEKFKSESPNDLESNFKDKSRFSLQNLN